MSAGIQRERQMVVHTSLSTQVTTIINREIKRLTPIEKEKQNPRKKKGKVINRRRRKGSYGSIWWHAWSNADDDDERSTLCNICWARGLSVYFAFWRIRRINCSEDVVGRERRSDDGNGGWTVLDLRFSSKLEATRWKRKERSFKGYHRFGKARFLWLHQAGPYLARRQMCIAGKMWKG